MSSDNYVNNQLLSNETHHEIVQILKEKMEEFTQSMDFGEKSFEEFLDELKQWRIDLQSTVEDVYREHEEKKRPEVEVDVSQVNHTQSDEEFEEEVRNYIFRRYESECL